ncbi:MAG TPA: hypothetical protein VFV66_21730 [Nonomuraea sp.]|nr:hypothetical protein [Nonomuraea sp.]
MSPDRQRWRDREWSWQLQRCVFDPDRYSVEPVDRTRAKAFVTRHHYTGSWPAVIHQMGMFDNAGPDQPRLVGVAALSYPTSNASLTNAFPGLEVGSQSLVLGRFVLLDDVPLNGESWALAETFRLAAELGLRGVLAYADPVARVATDGTVIMPGHDGVGYRSCNALYLGRTAARPMWLLPDATTIPERSLQKLRAGEPSAEHTARKLRDAGARPRRPGQSRRDWVTQALHQVGAVQIRHGGNHRFAWTIGPRPQRSRVTIGVPIIPFPVSRTAARTTGSTRAA